MLAFQVKVKLYMSLVTSHKPHNYNFPNVQESQ